MAICSLLAILLMPWSSLTMAEMPWDQDQQLDQTSFDRGKLQEPVNEKLTVEVIKDSGVVVINGQAFHTFDPELSHTLVKEFQNVQDTVNSMPEQVNRIEMSDSLSNQVSDLNNRMPPLKVKMKKQVPSSYYPGTEEPNNPYKEENRNGIDCLRGQEGTIQLYLIVLALALSFIVGLAIGCLVMSKEFHHDPKEARKLTSILKTSQKAQRSPS